MQLKELLQLTIDKKASDLHLVVGVPPILRVDGELVRIPGEQILSPEAVQTLLKEVMSSEQDRKSVV